MRTKLIFEIELHQKGDVLIQATLPRSCFRLPFQDGASVAVPLWSYVGFYKVVFV